MTTPRVLNVKTADARECIGAVPIWRGTKWGNEATLRALRGTVSRKEAVERFEAWLMTQPDLIDLAKQELRGKNLLCYCAPRKCHGDVLLRIANESTTTE